MSRFATLFALCFVLASCGKQTEGERCQINQDCEAPLVCATSSKVCAIGSSGIDAGPIFDAPFAIDAAPTSDAAPVIDAGPMIDAASLIDAP